MVRAGAPFGNGEISCFGGRFPCFNFTVAYGLVYENDEAIYVEMVYTPHSLTEADPATITYNLVHQGDSYSSGPLKYDAANVAEDPPHGSWGELFPARAGGFFQAPDGSGGAAWDWIATWKSDLGAGEDPLPVIAAAGTKRRRLSPIG